MDTLTLTPLMFSAARLELGTLGAIQHLMTSSAIPKDEQVPLLFSVADMTSLRQMELMEDNDVYFIVHDLCEGWKDGNSIVQEFVS